MLTPAEKLLHELLAARIVLLDGAMGTMIQRYKLDEAGVPRGALQRLAAGCKGQQ